MTPTAEWYTTFPAERAVLVELANSAPGHVLVEIGAFEGVTSADLAVVCWASRRRLCVVDPWDGTQDGAGEVVAQRFARRTAHYSSLDVQRCRSADMVWPAHVGFVFVDGDHRNPAPDLDAAWAALVPGGVLVVHDVFDPGWPQVAAAVDAFPASGRYTFRHTPTKAERVRYGPSPRGLAWFVKC